MKLNEVKDLINRLDVVLPGINDDGLNEWESSFIADLYNRIVEGDQFPTPKQIQKLKELEEKYYDRI